MGVDLELSPSTCTEDLSNMEDDRGSVTQTFSLIISFLFTAHEGALVLGVCLAGDRTIRRYGVKDGVFRLDMCLACLLSSFSISLLRPALGERGEQNIV